MQVVTDPMAATPSITDRVGEGLEDKLKELYPPPPKEEDEDEDADTRKKPAAQQQDKLRVSSFGRGKGTVFIVDRRTRGVLWSIYEKPKNTSAGEMDRTASRIVDHLKHDLKPAAPRCRTRLRDRLASTTSPVALHQAFRHDRHILLGDDMLPGSGRHACAASPFSNSPITRSAKARGVVGQPAQIPVRTAAKPSAPMRVDTTGMPAAKASSSFTRMPDPARIGQTKTA